MEFNEKLQELRKSRSLTQEELAEALFVSRTAVSKWESGRGSPSLDSLKEISSFFSVSIDDLISPDEIITVAEKEKETYINKNIALICSTLDIFLFLLFFVPVFGNGIKTPSTVELFGLDAVNMWIKIVFIVIISIMVLNGICGVILTNFNKPIWDRHRLVTGTVLSIISVIIFIITRQPYAGIICFSLLVIKGFIIITKYSDSL